MGDGITTIPTRTDGSLGRTKFNKDAITDLNVQYPAEEYNVGANTTAGLAREVGLTDGSTPGSLVARMNAVEAASGMFVWRPGGTQSGRTYTAWADLVAAVNARPWNERTVIVDSTDAPTNVPVGTWPVPLWKFVGLDPEATNLYLGEGVYFDPTPLPADPPGMLLTFEKMYVEYDATTAPCITLAPGSSLFLTVDYGQLDTYDQPLVELQAPFSGLFLTLRSAIVWSSGGPPGGTVLTSSPSMFICQMDGSSLIQDAVLSGNGNATVNYNDASSRIDPQTGAFTGTLTVNRRSVATAVEYDDTVVASPTLGATQVQGAIDAIKPLLAAAESDVLFQWNEADLTQFTQLTMKTGLETIVSSVGVDHRSAACIDTLYGVPLSAWDTRLLLVDPAQFVGGSLPPRYTIEMYVTHLEAVIAGPVAYFNVAANQGMAVFANETGINAYVQKYDASAILGQALGTGAQLSAAAASGNASRGVRIELHVEPQFVGGKYEVWAEMHSHSWRNFTTDANLLGETDVLWHRLHGALCGTVLLRRQGDTVHRPQAPQGPLMAYQRIACFNSEEDAAVFVAAEPARVLGAPVSHEDVFVVPVTEEAEGGGIRFAYLGDEGSIRNFNPRGA